jgi:hypothetical protein
MPKDTAYQTAVDRAIASLEQVDLAARCPALGLPEPTDGTVHTRVFGMDVVLDCETFALCKADGQPVKTADLILFLHYLMCERTVAASEDLIAFREFPGGQFYLPSFKARTTDVLLGRFGNDLESLRKNLSRFDWESTTRGDLGARIHAYGNIHVTLLYHVGDDELPAEASLLFDAASKRVLAAEDAAVLASRICIGLL